MFARATLRCRILPIRKLSIPHQTVARRPRPLLPNHRLFTAVSLRLNTATTEQHAPPKAPQLELNSLEELPKLIPPPYCPGCGAPSQQIDANLPGYFSPKQTKRQRFGPDNLKVKTKRKKHEDQIWEQALARIKAERATSTEGKGGAEPLPDTAPESTEEQIAQELNPAKPTEDEFEELVEAAQNLDDWKEPLTPVCARCHQMIHYHYAPPLPAYPTLDTLTNLLLSSPHKTNHIYHLLDAADLPMTLIPDLRNHLYSNLPREVTRGLTITYVVTRSDLFMPTEKQVGSLMTWIKKVVKDALPPGEKVEGWNTEEKIHVLSARQGWGIGKIKLETRHRAGGVWVVGAVNVGKSRLVREVWPEAGQGQAGSLEEADELDLLPGIPESALAGTDEGGELKASEDKPKKSKQDRGVRIQVPPTVSDIPGTTAAPIRVKYKTAGGVGKKVFGELVDLPGLERWVGFGDKGLLPFVREDNRSEFVMQKRVRAKQHTIKPGQSMVIAGLIMITPKITLEDELVVLAYPFIPLPIHVTSTKKALRLIADPDPAHHLRGFLYQKPSTAAASSAPEIEPSQDTVDPTCSLYSVNSHPDPSDLPSHFASAGIYTLSNSVTHLRNPALPSKDPAELAKLPYQIVATDILIAGLGWVELVAQVRRRKVETDGLVVQVEVFTPEGKGVGQRMTMGADMLRATGERFAGATKKPVIRQRRAMKGDKKRRKLEKRLVEAQVHVGTGID